VQVAQHAHNLYLCARTLQTNWAAQGQAGAEAELLEIAENA